MIFRQSWTGYEKNKLDDRFPARVPGNIQSDYANAHNYGDVNYGTNYKKYGWMEDTAWVYETAPVYEKSSVERVFFVSSGIDYEFDIEVNGNTVFTQEGMFTPGTMSRKSTS